MKIGLEFEGVIRSQKTGAITRWPQIDEKVRNTIKRMIYERREKVEPIDTYDCLAEVRTLPMLNPSPVDLINALYTEIELATNAFMANGYFIQWFEQEISDELHREIQHTIETNPNKIKKDTYTVTSKGCTDWRSEGNRFRGGGLHINVSPVPRAFATSFVMGLNRALFYQYRYRFQSHYRNNILFRTRHDASDKEFKEPIAEYMTFGFNVTQVQGWRETLARVAGNRGYDSRNNCDHIRWAWPLCDSLKQWFNEVQNYNALLK